MIAEASRFSELVDCVTQIVSVPLGAVFLRLLKAARDAGQIRYDCQVEEIARVLDGLITGWAAKQNLLGLDGLHSEAERNSFFDTAWTIFLNGITYS